jgi:hypothetical protein
MRSDTTLDDPPAPAFATAVTDPPQARRERRVEEAFLTREEGGQGVVRRLGHLRVAVGHGGPRHRHQVGVAGPFDRVVGVVHGRAGDREGAGRQHGPRLFGDREGMVVRIGLQNDVIPLEDRIRREQASLLQGMDTGLEPQWSMAGRCQVPPFRTVRGRVRAAAEPMGEGLHGRGFAGCVGRSPGRRWARWGRASAGFSGLP